MDSAVVAEYAIKQMLKKKRIIIPGKKMKLVNFFSRFASDKTLLKATYKIQKRKISK